jgi:hypothetical protein
MNYQAVLFLLGGQAVPCLVGSFLSISLPRKIRNVSIPLSRGEFLFHCGEATLEICYNSCQKLNLWICRLGCANCF